jgi:hypothetical protein
LKHRRLQTLKGAAHYLAVITARMKAGKLAHSPTSSSASPADGTAERAIAARFRYGVKDYVFGNHPLWEICRAGYQMTRKPYIKRDSPL